MVDRLLERRRDVTFATDRGWRRVVRRSGSTVGLEKRVEPIDVAICVR
jgi:hypothetical protein